MAHSTAAVWRRLGQLIATDSQLRGKLIPDAHLAALALSHDARVATRDRGFGRYPNLAWFDPAQTAQSTQTALVQIVDRDRRYVVGRGEAEDAAQEVELRL